MGPFKLMKPESFCLLRKLVDGINSGAAHHSCLDQTHCFERVSECLEVFSSEMECVSCDLR